MSAFSSEALVTILALVGIVIVIAALLSGVIERSGFPQVAVFLLIGAALGPAGLGIGILDLTLASPLLHIVATLSLVLVLFTDAISLNLSEVRRSSTLAVLVLGPGTLLSAALIAVLSWLLLGLSPAAAALVGAALASTDPVLLRGLLRRDDIPSAARQALRLESGLNDAVLLPIVLVAMAFLAGSASTNGSDWARLALDLFVLGPAAGVLVAVAGVATMAVIRRRAGIRRDYESLFSLGIAFTAYAAAEAVHGSGFLAAFTAGLSIAALDVELCDCFLEYGETTAEMTLLFTFVLFGASLIWSWFTILSLPLVVFALLAILVRPVAFLLSLARVRLSRHERVLIAWFGPRGLSSLLLVLLPVFAGIAGSEQLFAICSLVVLLSVIVHGGTPFILARRRPAVLEQPAINEEDQQAASLPPSPLPSIPLRSKEALDGTQSSSVEGKRSGEHVSEESGTGRANESREASLTRISLDEMRRLVREGVQVIVLDARTERAYGGSDVQARGAIRLVPDRVESQARTLGLPPNAWLIAYCA
ncbi:MAG: cation:proton antiporter [Ktedonobacteraceae bacterium]